MDTTTNVAEATQPTSEKLQALQIAAKAAWAEMLTHTDPMTKAAKDAKLAVLKLDGEMNAEIAAIAKAANEAKIAEARNERIALVSRLLESQIALLQLPKNATAEAKATAESNLATARETVENELLAKFAGSKPAKATANGEATANGTGRNTESKAAILELYHAGKSHAEIEAAGYPRSTVWHTINNFKKANATT